MGNRSKAGLGARYCGWIEAVCRVPEGADVGQLIKLRKWQREIICGIYDSPTRTAIVSFGRKNGKTALVACILLLHLVGPRHRINSHIYSAAQSRDQAALVFGYAAKMVRLSYELSGAVRIKDTAKELVCSELGTHYKALSADAVTAYGLSPALVIHDELGQVSGPRSELFDALETAAGAQQEPLSIIISTQAPNDADLLSTLIDQAALNTDKETKLYLWASDPEADPWIRSTWAQANPALGDFLNEREVARQSIRARALPAQEPSFRNLILNQRVQAKAPFLSREVWKRNAGDSRPLDGPVYIGLDLSATTDLTSLVAVSQAGGVFHVEPFFWTPEEGLKERARRDRAPYDVWAKQGHLLTTPGVSIDYDWIARFLIDFAAERNLAAVAFDRWRIDQFKSALERQEAPKDLSDKLMPFGQGYASMGPAMDAVEIEMLNGRVRHGEHPVLTMCAMNSVVVRDPAGNRKLDKSKSTGRIDGMVALTMAIGAAMNASKERPKNYQMLFV